MKKEENHKKTDKKIVWFNEPKNGNISFIK